MTDQSADQKRDIRSIIEQMRAEYGDDRDLIRQLIADWNAADRGTQARHFESRKEYMKHVADLRQSALQGIVNYGLQTLKWLFLLNAGAITVVLAYVGGAIGKSGSASLSQYDTLLTSLWPFAFGCMLVVLAGATGFFNFSYAEGLYPSPEALHNFLDPDSRNWPLARLQKDGESPHDFYKRFGWKEGAARTAAIIFTLLSAISFGLGVCLILRAVNAL